MIFMNFCFFVHWTKVTLAAEGLKYVFHTMPPFKYAGYRSSWFPFASSFVYNIPEKLLNKSANSSPSNAETTFVQSTWTQEFLKNHLNPVLLVFIG